MADSIHVLLDSKRFGGTNELVRCLRERGAPLDFESDWCLEAQEGWLPMVWHHREAGCDVDIEKVVRKRDLRKALGCGVEADTTVALTPRGGWASYGSAVLFAGALASCAGGVILNEGECLSGDDAWAWAEEGSRTAEERIRQEAEGARLRTELAESGTAERALGNALEHLAGKKVTLIATPFAGMLQLLAAGGERLGSAQWRLKIGERQYEYGRRSAWNHARMKWVGEVGEIVGAEIEREWARWDERGKEALTLDQDALDSVFAELTSWPQTLTLLSVERTSSNEISVRFDGFDGQIQFLGVGGNPVTLSVGALRFSVYEDGELAVL